jgi:hypothetical protein
MASRGKKERELLRFVKRIQHWHEARAQNQKEDAVALCFLSQKKRKPH